MPLLRHSVFGIASSAAPDPGPGIVARLVARVGPWLIVLAAAVLLLGAANDWLLVR